MHVQARFYQQEVPFFRASLFIPITNVEQYKNRKHNRGCARPATIKVMRAEDEAKQQAIT